MDLSQEWHKIAQMYEYFLSEFHFNNNLDQYPIKKNR